MCVADAAYGADLYVDSGPSPDKPVTLPLRRIQRRIATSPGIDNVSGVSKRNRSVLLVALAVVLWISGAALILFAEELIIRITGVIAFAAAVPLAIAGGRGFRDRH